MSEGEVQHMRHSKATIVKCPETPAPTLFMKKRIKWLYTRCCRCVGSGSCLRCSSVMRGTVCGDCYPSKKGRCLNQSH